MEKHTGNKVQPNNYYKRLHRIITIRDYTEWHDHDFLDDLSIQKWENDLQDMNEIYDDFTWRFKSCVNRHAHRKEVNKRKQK